MAISRLNETLRQGFEESKINNMTCNRFNKDIIDINLFDLAIKDINIVTDMISRLFDVDTFPRDSKFMLSVNGILHIRTYTLPIGRNGKEFINQKLDIDFSFDNTYAISNYRIQISRSEVIVNVLTESYRPKKNYIMLFELDQYHVRKNKIDSNNKYKIKFIDYIDHIDQIKTPIVFDSNLLLSLTPTITDSNLSKDSIDRNNRYMKRKKFNIVKNSRLIGIINRYKRILLIKEPTLKYKNLVGNMDIEEKKSYSIPPILKNERILNVYKEIYTTRSTCISNPVRDKSFAGLPNYKDQGNGFYMKCTEHNRMDLKEFKGFKSDNDLENNDSIDYDTFITEKIQPVIIDLTNVDD